MHWIIDHKPAKQKKIKFEQFLEVLLESDVLDDVLAKDAGVGHDGTEDEHDAGQDPDRERCDSLEQNMQH